MNKALLIFALTLSSQWAFAGDKAKLIGVWNCQLTSESSSYDLSLELTEDKQFTNKWAMKGDKHVEKGLWRMEGASMLVLSRKFYGKNEKEKESSREFRRGIVKLDENILELRYEGVTTKCQKAKN